MVLPARFAPCSRSRIPGVLASAALPVALLLLGGCGPEEAAAPAEEENTEDPAEDDACTGSVSEGGGMVACADQDLEIRYGGGNFETEQVNLHVVEYGQWGEDEGEGVLLQEGESEEVLGRIITFETVNLDATPSYVDFRVTWADED